MEHVTGQGPHPWIRTYRTRGAAKTVCRSAPDQPRPCAPYGVVDDDVLVIERCLCGGQAVAHRCAQRPGRGHSRSHRWRQDVPIAGPCGAAAAGGSAVSAGTGRRDTSQGAVVTTTVPVGVRVHPPWYSETFDTVGARPWADRAARDLARVISRTLTKSTSSPGPFPLRTWAPISALRGGGVHPSGLLLRRILRHQHTAVASAGTAARTPELTTFSIRFACTATTPSSRRAIRRWRNRRGGPYREHRAEHMQPAQHTPVDDQMLTRGPHRRPAATMVVAAPQRFPRRDQPPQVPRGPLVTRGPGGRQQPLRGDPAPRLVHPIGHQLADRVVVAPPRLASQRSATGLVAGDHPPHRLRCGAADRSRATVSAYLAVGGSDVHPFPRRLQWSPRAVR